MIRLLLSTVLLFILALTNPVSAEYEFHPITSNEVLSENCRVAANPAGDVVVVWTEGYQIFSRSWIDGSLGDTVPHGSGTDPTIAWNEEGFWLAWGFPAGISIKLGDGETWGESEFLTGTSSPPHALNLTGNTPPHQSDNLYLTFSDEDGVVWFLPRQNGELVVLVNTHRGNRILARSSIPGRVHWCGLQHLLFH